MAVTRDPITGQRFVDGSADVNLKGVNSSGSPEDAKVINGAILIRTYASDVPFPQEQVFEAACNAGAADNAVLYTSTDLTAYNTHTIQNNSGVDVDVQVSLDGTTYVGPVGLLMLDNVLTTIPSTPIPTTKIGVLRAKIKYLRLDQAASGAVAAGSVLIAHGVE